MFSFYTFVFVICTAFVSHSDADSITLQQYSTIEIGWTRDQVTQLIGSQGNVISQSGYESGNWTTIQYTGSKSSSSAKFGFQGEILYSKSQYGLDTTVYQITPQQYSTIQIGWTQDQVTQLIGSQGVITSQSGYGGSNMTTIQYTGSQSSSSATFTFQGSVLYSKSQDRLDTTVYQITQQQYDQLAIGLTRDEITNLVGNPGIITSETGTGNTSSINVQYQLAGSSYGVVYLRFYGEKLNSQYGYGFASTINNKISFQQYSIVQVGWTQQHVIQFLGCPGTITSQSGTQDLSNQWATIQYTGSESSFPSVEFNFQGGKIYRKSRYGIDFRVYTMTQQQFLSIQIGWTRNQITNFVGSEGSIISESVSGNTNYTTVVYIAPGNSYGTADLYFVNETLSLKSGSVYFSSSNTINLQQYTKIQIGWTQDQVTQLIGSQGIITSQSGTVGSPNGLTTIQYTGSQSSSSSATFNFQGSILYRKSQYGLDTTVYPITQQQYNQLEIGWTRDEVTNLVGNPGIVTSESGTGNTTSINVQYQPAGKSSGSVSLGFYAGKLRSRSEYGFK
ncbi:unnamed protein product [Adineta ricciae]|uniref:Jacalin-type lectin domain-containing protein n=1 Tax=Adineta ricciae TaxID=249248 RepID=A0A815NVN3_ADIRI|nr:unnamed protein product [Adineta ricciae]CAF1648957.1 unnamed protein product [Adineta ricciae]